MSKVLVIDTNKKALNPIHSAQARQLLRNKKAAVFRRFPFTIILNESYKDVSVDPLRVKIDPGAKFSGIAIVNDATGEEPNNTTALVGVGVIGVGFLRRRRNLKAADC